MRSRILSIAEVSRAVPELFKIGVVFDGRLLGAGREEEAPVIREAASGNSGAAFGVPDFDVLLVFPVGTFFCGGHYIEKRMKFIIIKKESMYPSCCSPGFI